MKRNTFDAWTFAVSGEYGVKPVQITSIGDGPDYLIRSRGQLEGYQFLILPDQHSIMSYTDFDMYMAKITKVQTIEKDAYLSVKSRVRHFARTNLEFTTNPIPQFKTDEHSVEQVDLYVRTDNKIYAQLVNIENSDVMQLVLKNCKEWRIDDLQVILMDKHRNPVVREFEHASHLLSTVNWFTLPLVASTNDDYIEICLGEL